MNPLIRRLVGSDRRRTIFHKLPPRVRRAPPSSAGSGSNHFIDQVRSGAPSTAFKESSCQEQIASPLFVPDLPGPGIEGDE